MPCIAQSRVGLGTPAPSSPPPHAAAPPCTPPPCTHSHTHPTLRSTQCPIRPLCPAFPPSPAWCAHPPAAVLPPPPRALYDQPQPASNACPAGFRPVVHDYGKECLKLRPGMEMLAAGLETRRCDSHAAAAACVRACGHEYMAAGGVREEGGGGSECGGHCGEDSPGRLELSLRWRSLEAKVDRCGLQVLICRPC